MKKLRIIIIALLFFSSCEDISYVDNPKANIYEYDLGVYNIAGLSFIDENSGYLINNKYVNSNMNKSSIYYYNGISWECFDEIYDDFKFSDIYMINKNSGWVIGNKEFSGDNIGQIFKIDNGSTRLVKEYLYAYVNSVHFANENFGIVVGSPASFMYKNGEWTIITELFNKHLYDVFCFSESNYWVAGSQTLHFDGTNFITQNLAKGQSLETMFFIDQNNGWGCDYDGNIYHYDGTSWIFQKQYDSQGGFTKFYPGFLDNNNGYFVSESGYVLKYSANSWETILAPDNSTNTFRCIEYVGGNDVWIGGHGLYHYTLK